jgi:probable HAF family extracellular repeat protein
MRSKIIFLLLYIVFLVCVDVQAQSYQLLKTASDPKVYLVIDNRRVHIPNPSVFEAGGYKWSEIKTVSDNVMNKIPDTALIKSPIDAKVYLVKDGTKQWIPDEKTFLDTGYKWNDIVLISQAQVDYYSKTEFVNNENTKATQTEVKVVNPAPAQENKVVVSSSTVDVKPNNLLIKTSISKEIVTKSSLLQSINNLPVQEISSVIDFGGFRNNVVTQPFAINDNDEVVGCSLIDENGGEAFAFHWQNGKMTKLKNLLGITGTCALSINNKSQIVGYSSLPLDPKDYIPGLDQAGDIHPVLWENGEIKDLGKLPGSGTKYGGTAYDINNLGQIVGHATIPNPDAKVDNYLFHAFLWQGGIMSDLGTMGGKESRATSINDKGEIVGYVNDDNGLSRAFLWRDGTMYDLSTNTFFAGGSSQALEINNQGQIVGVGGYRNDRGDFIYCSFIWDNGVMRIINDNGHAQGINDFGQIINGTGLINNNKVQSFVYNGLTSRSGGDFYVSAINNQGSVVARYEEYINKNYLTKGLLFKIKN